MDLSGFRRLPILGILRSAESVDIEGIVETVISSGLTAMEIAMNSAGAGELIRRGSRASRGRLAIGAGTVLNMDILKEALDSGASFIVMPALIDDVTSYCAKNKIPVFPGALTPQEVHDSWSAGATMVKVFPASVFGPSYIKELKAPFDKVEILACGGVNAENIRDYFDCGADAVAFGASIFRREWLKRSEFENIGRSIKDLIANAPRQQKTP